MKKTYAILAAVLAFSVFSVAGLASPLYDETLWDTDADRTNVINVSSSVGGWFAATYTTTLPVNVSGYILEWNYTASAVMTNDTWVAAAVDVQSQLCNVSKSIDNVSLEGGTFAYRLYGNDTSNSWNVTPFKTFTVTNEAPEWSSQSNTPASPNTEATVYLNITITDNWAVYPTNTVFETSYAGVTQNRTGTDLGSGKYSLTLSSDEINKQQLYSWKVYMSDKAVYGTGGYNWNTSDTKSFTPTFVAAGADGGGAGVPEVPYTPPAPILPEEIAPPPAPPHPVAQFFIGVGSAITGFFGWLSQVFAR